MYQKVEVATDLQGLGHKFGLENKCYTVNNVPRDTD